VTGGAGLTPAANAFPALAQSGQARKASSLFLQSLKSLRMFRVILVATQDSGTYCHTHAPPANTPWTGAGNPYYPPLFRTCMPLCTRSRSQCNLDRTMLPVRSFFTNAPKTSLPAKSLYASMYPAGFLPNRVRRCERKCFFVAQTDVTPKKTMLLLPLIILSGPRE